MTRVQAKRALQCQLGPRARWRAEAVREGGLCVLRARKRSGEPARAGIVLLVARATTWERCHRQALSGGLTK